MFLVRRGQGTPNEVGGLTVSAPHKISCFLILKPGEGVDIGKGGARHLNLTTRQKSASFAVCLPGASHAKFLCSAFVP
jgi:hypothetical protein